MTTFTLPLWRVSELTHGDIGLATYPIFDDTYREPLNKKIFDHFYNQEIGNESVDIWLLGMRRKMNEIMAYYNPILKSQLIQFDPLSSVDLSVTAAAERTAATKVDGISTATSDNKAKSRAVQSEFPQTNLNNNADYATNATDSASDTQATSNNTEDSTQNVTANDTNTSTTKGYQGPASELLTRYRATILNVDLMIIGELDELFMGVWDNGDSYTSHDMNYLGY
jgi:hypothetical protein